MRNRLKLIGLQIIIFVCISLTLLLNVSCEPTTAVKSSVSYEQVDNRRLKIQPEYKSVKIELKVEQPIAGMIVLLDEITNDSSNQKIKTLSIKEDVFLWTTDVVKLRTKASKNSDVLLKIPKRDKVQMISSSDGWVEVIYLDIRGYIKEEYLRETELPLFEFTEEEIDMLAKILWLESRGEKDEGMAACCVTIFNRILSINFSDSLYEVLSDSNQFSTWKSINKARPTEREYEIIYEVLNNEWDELLTPKTVYFSTTPRNKKIVAKIGGHYFCEE